MSSSCRAGALSGPVAAIGVRGYGTMQQCRRLLLSCGFSWLLRVARMMVQGARDRQRWRRSRVCVVEGLCAVVREEVRAEARASAMCNTKRCSERPGRALVCVEGWPSGGSVPRVWLSNSQQQHAAAVRRSAQGDVPPFTDQL